MRITRSGDSGANDNDGNNYSLTTLNALLRFDTIPERGQKGRKGIMRKVAAREKRLPADIVEQSLKSSPRRMRAKYTHRTNLRFMLCVFRGCAGPKIPDPGGLTACPGAHPRRKENKNAKAFFYTADKTS